MKQAHAVCITLHHFCNPLLPRRLEGGRVEPGRSAEVYPTPLALAPEGPGACGQGQRRLRVRRHPCPGSRGTALALVIHQQHPCLDEISVVLVAHHSIPHRKEVAVVRR